MIKCPTIVKLFQGYLYPLFLDNDYFLFGSIERKMMFVYINDSEVKPNNREVVPDAFVFDINVQKLRNVAHVWKDNDERLHFKFQVENSWQSEQSLTSNDNSEKLSNKNRIHIEKNVEPASVNKMREIGWGTIPENKFIQYNRNSEENSSQGNIIGIGYEQSHMPTELPKSNVSDQSIIDLSKEHSFERNHAIESALDADSVKNEENEKQIDNNQIDQMKLEKNLLVSDTLKTSQIDVENKNNEMSLEEKNLKMLPLNKDDVLSEKQQIVLSDNKNAEEVNPIPLFGKSLSKRENSVNVEKTNLLKNSEDKFLHKSENYKNSANVDHKEYIEGTSRSSEGDEEQYRNEDLSKIVNENVGELSSNNIQEKQINSKDNIMKSSVKFLPENVNYSLEAKLNAQQQLVDQENSGMKYIKDDVPIKDNTELDINDELFLNDDENSKENNINIEKINELLKDDKQLNKPKHVDNNGFYKSITTTPVLYDNKIDQNVVENKSVGERNQAKSKESSKNIKKKNDSIISKIPWESINNFLFLLQSS